MLLLTDPGDEEEVPAGSQGTVELAVCLRQFRRGQVVGGVERQDAPEFAVGPRPDDTTGSAKAAKTARDTESSAPGSRTKRA